MPAVPLINADAFSEGGGSATRNFHIGSGAAISSSATEANRQTKFKTAGTLSRLWVNILTNDHTASSTLRVRKAAANGNLVCTVPSSSTGVFEDVTNSDSVAVDDLMNLQFVIGTGGTVFTCNVIRLHFTATTGHVTVFSNTSVNVSGNDVYTSIVGPTGGTTSENNNTTRIPFACTFRNIGMYVSANTRDAAVTIRSRVNTADGAQSFSIPSTSTGWFEDASNTDSIAAGDLINFKGVTAGTTGTVTMQTKRSEILEPTGKKTLAASNGTDSQANNITNYMPISGDNTQIATEANEYVALGIKAKLSNLTINVTTNTVSATSTLNLRKNGANSTISVSITASTTGRFTDSTNVEKVSTTDTLNYQIITGATGSSLSWRVIGMQVQRASSSSNMLLMGI